ncbi:MAG: sodium/proline symporter PutP [Ruminococcaceae bacterium]|nr:sodium/proline symporter PutP [Oscillospiraceae bacterium]
MEIFSFVLYFVVVLAIGIYFFAKSKNEDEKDYFLGGRAMGPWVTAMSAQASDMSGWLLMGLPASMLAVGFGQAWVGIGLALGTAANWIFCAKRLRCFSKESNDSITLPQYLSNRFLSKGKMLQVFCAVIFLVFFTFYVASAFVAGTEVFTALFGDLNVVAALSIFSVIVIVYTFLGGFKAVCWTDFFQGLMMLIALLAVPIVIILSKDAVLNSSLLNNPINGEVFVADFFDATPVDILSGLGWGLGYFGMPHILVRFMSIKKPSMIKKSATVAIVWVILSLGAAILLAYLGRMLVVDGVNVGEELLISGKGTHIFISASRLLFPGIIAGFLLAAIIAASMSTADSQLLVASSSFTSDIYKPIIRKNASNKETLWVGRIVVLIISVVAFFIALSALLSESDSNPIMSLVDMAWAGFGGSFGPVVLLSLFWKRLTYKGACAGVLVGAVVDIVWMMAHKYAAEGSALYNVTSLYEIIPAFICGLLAAIVVSLIDKKPSQEVEQLFDNAVAECKAK